MNNISLIFSLFILKLIISIKFNDSYIFNFILIYGYYFQLTSNHMISLAVSLINLFASTFFRYMYEKDYNKAIAINTMIFICLLFYSKQVITFITPYVQNIIFFGVGYILLSLAEWVIHKYVMHCNKKSFYYSLLNKIDFNGTIEDICDCHIQHHKEVLPNMDMTGVKDKTSLFMGWNVCVYVSVLCFAALTIAKAISQIKISYKTIFLYTVALSILWSYLWNKVHPLMHRYEDGYSLKKGPYESVLDFTIINKLFYRNHAYHHIQKGTKKGNYNVVVFGADEWLGTNVQIIDNKEYCSNPQVANEEICKTV